MLENGLLVKCVALSGASKMIWSLKVVDRLSRLGLLAALCLESPEGQGLLLNFAC